jgi:RimJ/RimL family protein N-acetyltransferase
VKWLGDGVMFHFADPGRAILSGLDLIEQTERAISVPARIGINAGTVIAQEGDYFGRTVNIAARIADYARPHEVLVSEDAKGSAGLTEVEFELIGDVPLKGVSSSVRLHKAIRLVPLTPDHEPGVAELVDDEGVREYTRVPTKPNADFAAEWLAKYEEGWRDGSRAGFAIETHGGEFLGLGLFVSIESEGRQGEIGYVVGPAARGRGVATRTLRLLTDWGFTGLGLERIELWIDVSNAGSERVAQRVGYVHEGVLRSCWFKEDIRRDFGIWSRLLGDP